MARYKENDSTIDSDIDSDIYSDIDSDYKDLDYNKPLPPTTEDVFNKIDVTFGSTPTPPPPPPPPSTTTKKKKKNTRKPIPQPRKEHVNHHQSRNHQLPLPSQVLLLIYLSRSSQMVRYCHLYSQMVHYCFNYHVSSQPILHISIAHILLPSSTYFNSLFSIFCNQYLDIASDSYPATGIDTASSIVNTSTAYIPPITIPMTTTTSVAVASDASTATTSFNDPTTASFPAASTTAASMSTGGPSVPTTAGPFALTTSVPTTVAPSVHTTTTAASVPVTLSDFTLDPVQAKEFFDASDDDTLSLTDFLRKMDSVKDIYGADTEMITGLTSNTKDHEKAKIKVHCLCVCCCLVYLIEQADVFFSIQLTLSFLPLFIYKSF